MPPAQRPWTEGLPARRLERARDAELPASDVWPLTIPAVAQVLAHGIDLAACTVLVGENGSGKSTLVEALAMAAGMNAEGGSTGATHRTHASESPLHEWVTVVRDPGAPRWGYFVRAETMHGLFTWLDTNPGPTDPAFHAMSHGESFVTLLGTRRFRGEGLFVLDEPEAGLSFAAQLHLVAELAEMARRPRTQVVLATHSPVLAAIPGASVLELGEHGIRPTTWDELDVVRTTAASSPSRGGTCGTCSTTSTTEMFTRGAHRGSRAGVRMRRPIDAKDGTCPPPLLAPGCATGSRGPRSRGVSARYPAGATS